MSDFVLDPYLFTRGNTAANPILVVGEAWGQYEAQNHLPLIGPSGQEFEQQIVEAGLDPSLFLYTNLVDAQPPDNLLSSWFYPTAEAKHLALQAMKGLYPRPIILHGLRKLEALISITRPRLIITLGNYPLWALTNSTSPSPARDRKGKASGVLGPSGIASYRGSMLGYYHQADSILYPVLPLYHPAAVLRQRSLHSITVHDLAKRVPLTFNPATYADWLEGGSYDIWFPLKTDYDDYGTLITKLEQIVTALNLRPTRIVIDVETHAASFITCVGIGYNPNQALSIPLVNLGPDGSMLPFWSLDQEHYIVGLLRRILLHPNALIEGQNFIYDTQHLYEWLGIHVGFDFDTMLAHHLIRPGTKQDLGYLSSFYREHHVFWKDDNRDWAAKGDLSTHLRYNARDCIAQYEIGTLLRAEIAASPTYSKQWPFEKYKQRLGQRMTFRGLNIDEAERKRQILSTVQASQAAISRLEHLLPSDPTAKTAWYNSPAQLMSLLYDGLGLHPVLHKKTKARTIGKEAIKELRTRYPGLKPILDPLALLRSFKALLNVLQAKLDRDHRLRCTFRATGTSTFRFSSSENSFHRGTNLQNVPKGKLTDFDLSIGEQDDGPDTDEEADADDFDLDAEAGPQPD